jgi:DNA-binding response OmpR family regulator
MTEGSPDRPAMLLVATQGDWAGRSLESVLTVKGYSVLRTQSGRDAVALARRTRPDAVIVDHRLAELDGVEVCRRLRDDPTFDGATPLIVIAGAPASRDERIAAHEAGAWAVWTQPLDVELLAQELATYVRARRASAASREAALVDPETGFLTPVGLERWAEQLSARAARKHEPLACVVLMPAAAASSADAIEAGVAGADIAAVLAGVSPHLRQSDILGRTAQGRLAVLAPDTDDTGVQMFVERLRKAIDAAARRHPREQAVPFQFRAGFYAMDDFSTAITPADLIHRASLAVDHAGLQADTALAFNFKQLPLN